MSSSSTINSNLHSENITAREHISNFRNLPFFIYFTSPYSPLPPHLTHLNLSAFFNHIPTEAIPFPTSPPPQRLILVESGYHYRYIIDRRPIRDNPSTHNTPTRPQSPQSSQSSTISYSSLPPLVPTSTFTNQSEPPPYTESCNNLPRYRSPERRVLIQRSIDTLERDYLEFENQTIRHRDLTIARLTADTDTQLTEIRESTQAEIRRLEDLLRF